MNLALLYHYNFSPEFDDFCCEWTTNFPLFWLQKNLQPYCEVPTLCGLHPSRDTASEAAHCNVHLHSVARASEPAHCNVHLHSVATACQQSTQSSKYIHRPE